MKSKITWSSFLLVGLVLLLLASVVACGPAPTATPAPTPTPSTTPTPPSALAWSEAKYHIGERTTVFGPVVDTRWASGSKGKPTFLNIGKPYPDPERFTVVIWIQNRSKFPDPPEDYYLGKTIYVTGLITEYKGIPQIEVTDPTQIQKQ